jgi:hypothetical protein
MAAGAHAPEVRRSRERSAAVALAVLAVVLGSIGLGGCTMDPEPSSETASSSSKLPSTEPDLHRSFERPRLAAGESCPRTPGGRPNPDIGVALGSGPVYPVLGLQLGKPPPAPEAGVLLYDTELRDGAYWHKTLWAVDPRYDGPVLIRGRALDAPHAMQFVVPSGGPGGSQRHVDELEFPAEESETWRYGPSITVLPGPGCYAFQVDGTSFSDVIVFKAVHPLEGKPQRRTLSLAAGRASGRFKVIAFDPPTHTYDVRVRTDTSADISVWIRTWYGQRLRVLDSLEDSSFCHLRHGRADCLFPFPALEAQRAGLWTVIARKRSGPPVRVRIAVTFNRL